MILLRATVLLAAALLVAPGAFAGATDSDGDGVEDAFDNCVSDWNRAQLDTDGDGIGNACDVCLENPAPIPDQDGDSIGDDCDDCPGTISTICRDTPLPEGPDPIPSVDHHGCSLEQLCPCEGPRDRESSWRSRHRYVRCVRKKVHALERLGVCPSQVRNFSDATRERTCGKSRPQPGDADGDGVRDDGDESRFAGDRLCESKHTTACDDNCLHRWNPHQLDTDNDGKGDRCDWDDDNDKVADRHDNCQTAENPEQEDDDDDGVGDACDECPDSDAGDDVNEKGCS